MPIIYQAEDGVEPVSDSFAEQVGNQHLYGWLSGCDVTYSLSDMTVDLAAGQILFNGAPVTVATATGAWTIVADGTNPRWSWLALDNTGAPVLVSGTPAAQPTVPELGDRVAVALLLVPANETIADNITYKLDKRVPTHTPLPPGGWEVIDTQQLSTTATSVSFQSIPTTFRAFRLTIYVQNDANGKDVYLRLNNDSGNNYDWNLLDADGASVASTETQNTAQILFGGGSADVPANGAWSGQIVISKPLATTWALTSGTGSYMDVSPNMHSQVTGGRWENTADLISRIDVIASSNNFAAGTTVMLEGAYFQ